MSNDKNKFHNQIRSDIPLLIEVVEDILDDLEHVLNDVSKREINSPKQEILDQVAHKSNQED